MNPLRQRTFTSCSWPVSLAHQRDYYQLSAILQTALDPYDWVPPTERLLEIGLASERKEIEKP